MELPIQKQDVAVFWDFDGTLVSRPTIWSESFVQALEMRLPGHDILAKDIRQHLSFGFPWHTPECPWLDERDDEMWWKRMADVFFAALCKLGIHAEIAKHLSVEVRHYILQNQRKNVVFDEVHAALSLLKENGISQYLLSNHVPELESIVSDVGLSKYFEEILTSSRIGYCKPHLEIFKYAKSVAQGSKMQWMIGDNLHADFEGAARAGMNAVLVRNKLEKVEPSFENALQAVKFILSRVQGE